MGCVIGKVWGGVTCGWLVVKEKGANGRGVGIIIICGMKWEGLGCKERWSDFFGGRAIMCTRSAPSRGEAADKNNNIDKGVWSKKRGKKIFFKRGAGLVCVEVVGV